MVLSFNLNARELKNFTLPVFNTDKQFVLKDELKKGSIVLNFWASWCTACIKEIPELESLKKKYSNKAQFFAINAGDKAAYINRFTKRHGFSYTILHDKDKSFCKENAILELPRTIVIDPSGKTVYDSNVPPTKI